MKTLATILLLISTPVFAQADQAFNDLRDILSSDAFAKDIVCSFDMPELDEICKEVPPPPPPQDINSRQRSLLQVVITNLDKIQGAIRTNTSRIQQNANKIRSIGSSRRSSGGTISVEENNRRSGGSQSYQQRGGSIWPVNKKTDTRGRGEGR